MNWKSIPVAVIAFGLGVVASDHGLIQNLWHETSRKEITYIKPDRDTRDTMMHKGRESYRRGKFLKSKWYFRRAIMNDPAAFYIWEYYDQATIFAFAERIEQDGSLLFMKRKDFAEEKGGKPARVSSPSEMKERIKRPSPGTDEHPPAREDEGC